MAATLDGQVNQLKQVFSDKEAQIGILGDEIVVAILLPTQRRLADLKAMAADSTFKQTAPPTCQRKLITML